MERRLEVLLNDDRSDARASLQYRYLRKDGEIRWVEGSSVTLRNNRGETVGHVGTVMDVTERIAAAEALQQEQDLLRESIEYHERERQLMAYDIHDGIIQYTTGALLFLETYKDRRESRPGDHEIEPALNALRQAIADGRRVMNGLRPPLLDDAGVVPAIEALAGEWQAEELAIEVIADRDLGRLRPELESTIYRIAQEALINAIKHSVSGKIEISIGRNGKFVRLVVQDWGIGFDLRSVPRGVHGLSGMRERAMLIGGKCDICSSPNEGTCITVDLPLAEKRRVAQMES